jgi:hypothetical protein
MVCSSICRVLVILVSLGDVRGAKSLEIMVANLAVSHNSFSS